MKKPKVFLGGTTTATKDEWDWRKDLIPALKINYFDPFLRPWETDQDWDEKFQKIENREKKKADYTLYVITSDCRGFYSFCEVIYDSFTKPYGSVVICPIDYKNVWDKKYSHSMNAFLKMAQSNGCVVLSTLKEVADYLNRSER